MLKKKLSKILSLLKTKTGMIILASTVGTTAAIGGTVAYINSNKTNEVLKLEESVATISDTAESEPNLDEDKNEELELSEDEVIIEEKVTDENGNETLVTRTVSKEEAQEKVKEGKVVSQKPAPAKPLNNGSSNSSNSESSSNTSSSNDSNNGNSSSKPQEKPNKPQEKPNKPEEKPNKPEEKPNKPEEKPKPSIDMNTVLSRVQSNWAKYQGSANGRSDKALSTYMSTGSAPSGYRGGKCNFSFDASSCGSQDEANGKAYAAIKQFCKSNYYSEYDSWSTATFYTNGKTVKGTITYVTKA